MRFLSVLVASVAWVLSFPPLTASAATPRHVLFAFVDHFEPLYIPDYPEGLDVPLRAWVDDYMAMAQKHTDADGRHPSHGYFLMKLAETHRRWERLDDALPWLNRACYQGFGEVELHLHHETRHLPDPADAIYVKAAFASLMKQTLDVFNDHGALLTAEILPRRKFAFIHGLWALDDSRDFPDYRTFCGVNLELRYLRQLGCYADFTFPSPREMNPDLRDAIFYARDDEARASYKIPDNLQRVEVGQPAFGDLMIIEGPDTGTNISWRQPATLARMHNWVNHDVHVVGNDDWVFVKVYTHGAADDLTDPVAWEAFFGPPMDQFYEDIDAFYNDGVNWKLHFVSPREMFNVVKAAEAGKTGDPNDYRDFVLPPPANVVILTPNKYRLHSYHPELVLLETVEPGDRVEFSFKHFSPCSMVQEAAEVAFFRVKNGSRWQPSDAQISLGTHGELSFVDHTPSIYYRIIAQPCPPLVGDFDGDHTVGQDDFEHLVTCTTGSGLGPPSEPCRDADLDRDDDVDQEDFGRFQPCLGTTSLSAGADCGG